MTKKRFKVSYDINDEAAPTLASEDSELKGSKTEKETKIERAVDQKIKSTGRTSKEMSRTCEQYSEFGVIYRFLNQFREDELAKTSEI